MVVVDGGAIDEEAKLIAEIRLRFEGQQRCGVGRQRWCGRGSEDCTTEHMKQKIQQQHCRR